MRGNGQLVLFFMIAVAAGASSWGLGGFDAVAEGARDALALLVMIAPQIALGVVIAGFVYVLLPAERVAALLGAQSGLRGLALASIIGALVPGGPFASFPIVYALARSGADSGSVMAFLVGWAAVGIHRLVVWELPIMGLNFSMLRLLASLPLPILAGLVTRALVARHPVLDPFRKP